MRKHHLPTIHQLASEAILAELRELGYTDETFALLPLVPLVQMGWTESEVTRREARHIFKAATSHGIPRGSAAWEQLEEWIQARPTREFLLQSLHLLGLVLQALPVAQAEETITRILHDCAKVANASGDWPWGGASHFEDEALRMIAAQLRPPRNTATNADQTG